jgi:hypothetical protein
MPLRAIYKEGANEVKTLEKLGGTVSVTIFGSAPAKLGENFISTLKVFPIHVKNNIFLGKKPRISVVSFTFPRLYNARGMTVYMQGVLFKYWLTKVAAIINAFAACNRLPSIVTGLFLHFL